MAEYHTSENFKAHEMLYRAQIPGQAYVGLRFDGKAFHSFTRGFEKPFDIRLSDAMVTATKYLVQHTQGAILGYTQSDEISLVISNMGSRYSQLPFNGEVEKLLSVLTSQVAVAFYDALRTAGCHVQSLPAFDGRIAFVAKHIEVIEGYLFWRRTDSRTNAVQAACQALYSHKRLHQVGSDEQVKLLIGTDFERMPDNLFWGSLITKRQESVRGIDPRSGDSCMAIRTKVVDVPATRSNVSAVLGTLTNGPAVAAGAGRLRIDATRHHLGLVDA